MNIVTLGNETGAILRLSTEHSMYIDTDYSLHSMMSMMSSSFNYDSSNITPHSYAKERVLGNELNKVFVNNIEQISKQNDYIVIDLLDERYDLLKKEDSLVLNSWILRDSNVYKETKFDVIKRNSIDFQTWKIYCDQFIEVINEHFTKRVIIHEMYLSEEYWKDGAFHEFKNIEYIRSINERLNIYYNYLKKHLVGAKVIKVQENNYTDVNLLNVLNPAKKNEKYIQDLLNQVQNIEKQPSQYKVAVVIASYNVEDYIEEAVMSVLNQTLSDVQVIVVDDGSTDNTTKKVMELAEREERVSYRFLENTGSPSEPRNVGKKIADAEYVMFLDGDDYLDSNACEKMYNYAKNQEADLVVGRMMSFIGERRFETFEGVPRFRQRMEFLKGIKEFEAVSITENPVLYLFPSCCAKLYKKELIKNIDFNKNIKYAEDLLFSNTVFFQSKKTLVLEDFVYYYRGRGETSNSSITQQKSIQNLQDLSISVNTINSIIEKNKFSIKNKVRFNNLIQFYRMLEASQHVGSIIQYPQEEQIKVLKLVRETLFNDSFNKDKIKVFSFYNFIKMTLLLENKYEELVLLSQMLKKITMYDYVNKFPFKTVKRNRKFYFIFKYKGKNVSIDITHYVTSNKLINRLVDIKFVENQLILKGLAYINNISITNRSDIQHTIIMVNRKTKKEYKFNSSYAYNNKFSTSHFKYGHGGYEVRIPFNESMQLGGYDFYIETEFLGVKKQVPLGGMNNNFVYKANNHFMKMGNTHYEVVPIVKSRSKLAINYKVFPNKWSYMKRRLIANVRGKQFSIAQIKNNTGLSVNKKLKLLFGVITEDISNLILRKKDIWLVGEKVGASANDTGYWFFKHCREKYPNKNVYYLIDKKSPDYSKVKAMGNTIPFYSLKHIIYSMNAKYTFSSDNVNVLLPSNIKHLRKSSRVFIQHGIILPGRVENIYHANRDLADYILTSSNLEAQIIKNHFGYNPEEIWDCGLPRFDTLQNKEKEKRIMMTFTWRKNIQNLEQLMESKYFTAIQSLLHNSKFLKTLERNNIILDVCLHPRTCQLLEEDNSGILNSLKTSPNIEIHDFNKANVRELIERSSMMLTDYSSISFDFVYLEKPIINYLFQNNTPISEENIKNVLPGYVSYSEDDVIHAVESYLVKQRRLKKINKKHYIKYDDGRNCERLVKFASGSR
ncbi:CDP-glycerol glycerophosphotransferase family protein [Bacillus sp. Xin]|uniref:bifunctional glycosyltransferase/CDP-glycerol:glycerophosphate glycerophosphotransferase n=1 Tax=unclassified Bacillus (in: firmicutes) TaxID=185979 RepID=UPI001574D253|nr:MULTISPECIES: CDP-glycerol glycerophosphotransferase family protein [unclassified Bacillus (in: firmicutes)]MBC6976279.1 CDP-glycerol glycerophosphotransferase family protein [Bacillus sp. Xin]NSW36171.1 CDP-glycerol glycerophosphotransferase family protein [Bacillus sp. Xin1]